MLKQRFDFLLKVKGNISEIASQKLEENWYSFEGSAAEAMRFFEKLQAESAIDYAKKELNIIQEMLAEIRDELKNLQVELGLK
jgi:hypothetical protein